MPFNDANVPARSWSLADEAQLDAAISSEGLQAPAASPRRSLFTGATGFLGAYLLAQLLERTSLEFVCLVRAAHRADALRRIRDNLAHYALWQPEFEARLYPLASDLDRPYLGLDKREYRALAASVDVVHHVAAWSNFVLPYALLKPANVLGTQEMLRFATTTRLKPFHFVSSTAIYPGHDAGTKCFAETEMGDASGVAAGYPETKWVADKLVSLAKRRGVPVSIYRVGQLAGHSRTGRTKLDIFVTALVKGAIQLGCAYSVKPDIKVSVIPIDYAADAITEISLKEGAVGRVYNIVNRNTLYWSQCVAALNDYGYKIDQLPYEDWRARLIASKFEENALYPYLPLFPEHTPDSAHETALQVGDAVYDTANTDAALSGTGIACRAFDASLLHTYLDHFAATGYIEPPSSRDGT